jgi:hypothetical protein
MFADRLIGACAIVLSALVTAPASAKDRTLHYHGSLRAACGQEISQCRSVPDARGRLLACLYQHHSSLSPRCEGAIWGSMDRLGKILAKDQNVLRSCDIDARQWCNETVTGGGHLVSCFLISRAISPQCKAAVYSVWEKTR